MNQYQNVWVFIEIQDHERVLEGSLELLSKGRELADQLGEELVAVVLSLDADKYLSDIEQYQPDQIIYCSHNNLKHYNSELFPDIFTELINMHHPSILLLPSTEAGKDLAPRLAQRFSTGLTSHCTDLDISYIPEYKRQLLIMKRPAFSGNMIATIICPFAMPQMATVMPGVFEKKEPAGKRNIKQQQIQFDYDMEQLKVVNFEEPTRWDREHVPLEGASVIIAGGRGLCSKQNFDLLYELADLLGGEVGATRVPVFNKWCEEGRMIGQTGKTIKPRLYIGLGISGQIQHSSSIVDSEIIVSINTEKDAPIVQMSDYFIQEDATDFLLLLIKRLKEEKKLFREE